MLVYRKRREPRQPVTSGPPLRVRPEQSAVQMWPNMGLSAN